MPISAILRDYLDEHLLRLAWEDGLVFGSTAASPFPLTSTNRRAVKAWERAELNPITLDRYGHLMPGNEAEAAGILNAYMARVDAAARLAQIDTAA